MVPPSPTTVLALLMLLSACGGTTPDAGSPGAIGGADASGAVDVPSTPALDAAGTLDAGASRSDASG
jgi:hypothetical protein